MKKKYLCMVLAIMMLTSTVMMLLAACNSDSEDEIFRSISSGEGWDKYTFMVDEFSYNELNLKTGKTQKKTAYRLIKLDNETEELSHVCLDPVCTHEPYSDCPLVFSNRVVCWNHTVGDWLPFTAKDPKNKRTFFTIYNLRTGEIRQILSVNQDVGQISSASNEGKLYFVIPDLVNGDTIYKLKQYSPETDKWKELAVLDSLLNIVAFTNKRIYLAQLSYEMAYSEAESFSLDYTGNDRREEPEMKMAIAFKTGSDCYGAEYRDLQITEDYSSRAFAGYYIKYNIQTREKQQIPADEGATALGMWNGKIVYATCKDVRTAVTLNRFEYAAQNGLDPNDPAVASEVSRLRWEIMYGDKMSIKTCDLDGQNSEPLFEYPGLFIDSGMVYGDYMKCTISEIDKETGKITERNARIDLRTGEIEEIPTYSLGDIDDPIVKK